MQIDINRLPLTYSIGRTEDRGWRIEGRGGAEGGGGCHITYLPNTSIARLPPPPWDREWGGGGRRGNICKEL